MVRLRQLFNGGRKKKDDPRLTEISRAGMTDDRWKRKQDPRLTEVSRAGMTDDRRGKWEMGRVGEGAGSKTHLSTAA